MYVSVYWPASKSLGSKIHGINFISKHFGKGANHVKGDIRKIIIMDHQDKVLRRHVDRGGNSLAPLAASTLKDKRRGPGPALAPKGALSRFVKNLRVEWSGEGVNSTLIVRFVNIVDKKGRSFAQYHLAGVAKGSKKNQPNWSLPKRDVSGITPKGWSAIQVRFNEFIVVIGKEIVDDIMMKLFGRKH